MSRLIVASNRVVTAKDPARAGGLAVALHGALRNGGGVWFGWSGQVTARSDRKPTVKTRGKYVTATLDLTEDDFEEYYNGFANSTLWPLFHYRIDLASFEREHYQGYLRVNQRFAQGLASMLEPEDRIWVHDYHFMAFGEELRRMGCDQPMGFFLHIPFPARQVLTTLPVHDVVVRALFAYDIIGFQTEEDRQSFADYVIHEANGEDHGDGRLTAFGRTVQAKVFPIGMDAETFSRYAASKEAKTHAQRMKGVLSNRLAIVGVDRLDYSKGLPERFRAFERLLANYPANRERVSFIQVAPRSRGDVKEYVDIRHELETLAGRINAEYSAFDWTPLRYINRGFSRRALAGIYRTARVGLVTPLRDGMNLVAKEFVAAQHGRDPGVLVLSRFAGAAHQCDGALIVNPYDTEGVANAIQVALEMPLGERKERWKSLIAGIRKDNVVAWRESFLDSLYALPG